MCTDAEAAAGESPMKIRTVDEVIPYPIPSEPSTSWARNPATARSASRTRLSISVGAEVVARAFSYLA
jgi:hypothetical protein